MIAAAARRRARFTSAAVTVGLLALAGASLAHAGLEDVLPSDFSTVTDVVEVVLTFDADVEAAFSRFSVVRLTLPDGAWPADPAAPTDVERMRLHALAATQVHEPAAGAEMPLTIEPLHHTSEVRLVFAAPLAPGAYAVAYDVLAVDGHTTDGHVIFFVVGGN